MAEPARRTADWYELFFDLVFVVVIAVSADLIERDPRPLTVLLFLALFFPLWWAWVNLSVTTNLFGPRFPSTAVLLIAAMPGPAAMAIAMSGGIGQFGWLYALGAVWIRVVLLAMWLVPWARGAVGAPLWRLLAYNLGTAVLWIGSIWLPEPWRYVAWGLAVAIEVALLAIRRGFSNDIYERASMSHFLERVGLFVVIVIGEAVYLAASDGDRRRRRPLRRARLRLPRAGVFPLGCAGHRAGAGCRGATSLVRRRP
jgi:low temperature requirement protein LtrA